MRLKAMIVQRVGDDRGIALPMVLLIFFLSVALVSAFLVTIVGSSNVTAMSKTSVQASAAAEAGIADAVSQLFAAEADPCEVATNVISGTDPHYSVTIEFGTPSNWNGDCPDSNSQLRIVSAGVANGLTQTIERIYPVTHTARESMAFENLLRTSQSWRVDGNTTITSIDPNDPVQIFVTHGDFRCNGGTKITGDVYVLNGDAIFTNNNCKVHGNVVVSGDLDRSSGGVQVFGDAFVGGNVTLGGGTRPAIEGSLTHTGSLHVAWGEPSGWVDGAIVQGPITVPAEPAWQELDTDILRSKGFSLQSWTGNCRVDSDSHPMVETINAYSAPTVIEVPSTQCAEVYFHKNGDYLKLKTDVALVAKRIHFQAPNIKSGDGNSHSIILLSSQETSECTSESTIRLNGTRMTDNKIRGLAYAPCSVEITNYGGTNWVGSVYTNHFFGTPQMTYAPVTIGDSDEHSSPSDPDRLTVGTEIIQQRNITP